MNPGHELAMALRGAYWAMHRQADAQFAAAGVTTDQFVLLSILADADRLTQQELGKRATSDPNTVRAMLVLLERRGLVSRTPHPSDRRARIVALTAAGKRTYTQLWRQSEAFRTALAGQFKGVDAERLIADLHRITQWKMNSPAQSDSERARARIARSKSR